MVSVGPYTPVTDYTHMYSFVDYRSSTKPQICINKGSLYGFLKTTPGFSKFLKLVETAKMYAQINEIEADFTMFVPSDNFLQHLPPDYFDKMDDGLARQIFDASVLNRRIPKNLVVSSPVCYYTTRNPKMRMYMTNIGGRTQINNCVKVVKYDILLNNGIIHVVDGLIVPNEDHFMN